VIGNHFLKLLSFFKSNQWRNQEGGPRGLPRPQSKGYLALLRTNNEQDSDVFAEF